MKKLAQSTSEADIKRVYTILQGYGIPVSVTYENKRYFLWLLQPAFEAHARELMLRIAKHPEEFESQPDQTQSLLKPLWKTLSKQAGLVTFLVALAVLAVATAQLLDIKHTLRYLLIAHPNFPQIDMAEPWRLVTSAFLHFSATHLVFNLFWWWYLGGRVELSLGSKVLVGLFLFTAISSNLVQFYWQGPLFGGLSGVVYGLFGFAIVMSANRGGPLWLPPMLIAFMIGWLLIGFSEALPLNMANEAHLAGLISGFMAGVFVRFVLKR